ncbi:MAG: S41 family peptidase [Desulfovibrio sp.]|jgi:carboxyl-terminal processing protease|nr:S41 family peptidase [Desulfovibrio sp.]
MPLKFSSIIALFLACVFAVHPAVAADEEKNASHRAVSGKYDALKRFSQVLDLVERHYVKEVTQTELVNSSVKGMLQGLDPHSNFLTPEEFKEMQQNTSGEFFGVGIEISLENGQVVVVTPIEDTPAFRAGLQTGDVILSINGQAAQELSLQEVVSRIRGPKGTEVELTILHSNSKTPQTLRIVRDAIPLISVKSKKLEDGYYWIRLTRFSERTTEELKDSLKAAEKESRKEAGLKGIVLDLRNNPGGLLDQAVSVSDVFLEQGAIVSIKGRDEKRGHVYEAARQADDVHVPTVALINAGSASASEIVAGALRDQKRALILGERSFGKGSVQKIIPLPDGAGLKLTVALYYTPSGSSIQAEGIVPDMEVPFESQRADDKDNPRFQIREQTLNRHLENAGNKKSEDKDKSAEIRDQLARDNQLRMALQLVRTLPKIQEIKN